MCIYVSPFVLCSNRRAIGADWHGTLQPYALNIPGLPSSSGHHEPLEMALHWDQTPKKQGLYDPSMESDACGVGAVMDMNRKKSRKTLTDARDMAVRMTHRGAKQAHEDSFGQQLCCFFFFAVQ